MLKAMAVEIVRQGQEILDSQELQDDTSCATDEEEDVVQSPPRKKRRLGGTPKHDDVDSHPADEYEDVEEKDSRECEAANWVKYRPQSRQPFLEFWQGDVRKQFPRIAAFAEQHSLAFISGAPVERVFSIAARVIEVHGSNLNWSTLRDLVFLQANKEFIRAMKWVE